MLQYTVLASGLQSVAIGIMNQYYEFRSMCCKMASESCLSHLLDENH